MTINDLPDEVLLEIFDSYRHTLGDQLSSERVWNSKNGWFKLAHVCQSWRSVVLASPSRLRLRLYFSSSTPTRAAALERLTHLPIILDYSNVICIASAQGRFIPAFRYPDRVCRIAISGWRSYDMVTELLDRPFPALESLELEHTSSIACALRSPSLMSSIQSLRHLRLDEMSLVSVLPLLSFTRSLVDLTLDLDRVFLTKEASLLAYLQHMPHLHNLKVYSRYHPTEESPPTTSILLPELTSFRFVAERSQAEWFVAGLDTPSLREFHISITDYSRKPHTGTDILHLTKFIRAVGVDFVTAQLKIVGGSLMTDLFAPPHKRFTIETPYSFDPGIALSAMLTTLEDIFLMFPDLNSRLLEKPATWRKFFEEFSNVKVLRMLHGIETQVIEMLRQPTVNALPPQEEADPKATVPSSLPIITNGSQFTSNIFPSLEKIVLYEGKPNRWNPIGETERASMLKLFGPFVTARHELNCPVKVLWNTDEVPWYFTMAADLRGW